MGKLHLPDNFILGTATSAYQVEGAPTSDGKKESIWDTFFQTGMRKLSGIQTADFYSTFTKDIQLIQKLGITDFRFSLSWSRIFPDGTGAINPKGVDFYNCIIDTLLEHNIVPHVALYAHDLPARLQKNGGWLNRETSNHFTDYAELTAKKFGDRVKSWLTFEDPFTEMEYGYRAGTMAPGVVAQEKLFIAVHNILLAHAQGYGIIKALLPQTKIGFSTRLDPPIMVRKIAKVREVAFAYLIRLFLDPLILGYYPEQFEGEVYMQNDLNLRPKDNMLIKGSFDFIGIVHSGNTTVRKKIVQVNVKDYLPFAITKSPSIQDMYEDTESISTKELSYLLKFIRTEYENPPLIFTGVGFPSNTKDTNRDQRHILFYQKVLHTIDNAIKKGSSIEGFFSKSFLDGFEHTSSGKLRSGLIHVDFSNGERTRTKTADWYSGVCTTHEV